MKRPAAFGRPAAVSLKPRGFSLIELMVGITISLVVTLVIFSVLTLNENRRRTATSVNDVNQGGAFGMYVLDKAVRSAGSGLGSAQPRSFGCILQARTNGVAYLPRTATTFPAPFAAVNGTLRLAPALIGQSLSVTGSDVLIVMSGTAGFSESLIAVNGPTASGLGIELTRNPIGFNRGDLVLVGPLNANDCLVAQVRAAPAANTLNLTANAGAFTATAADMGAVTPNDAFVTAIGTTTVVGGAVVNPLVNPPQFRMYGVGANNTLFAYDPLNIDGTDTPAPFMEGVVEMRALYGVDADGNGTIDNWQAPTGAQWGIANLVTDATRLRQIAAIHVSLLLRTALPERVNASGEQVTADVLPVQRFATLPLVNAADTSFAANVDIPAGAARDFRYRLVESTIPVRNNLLPQ